MLLKRRRSGCHPKTEQIQQEAHQQLTLQMVNTIEKQFAALKQELVELQPQMLAWLIEFAEEFIALMFTGDHDLVREKIVSNLKLAMHDLQMDGEMTLLLNPMLLEDIGPQLQTAIPNEIQLRADPLLERADCRIEGAGQPQIARLKRHLELAKQNWLAKDHDPHTNN